MNFFKQIGSYLTLFKRGRIGNVEPGVEPNDVVVKSQLDSVAGIASYKRYVAIMSQSGTNAPVALVMENTLGATITWSYDNVGNYYGTLSSAVLTTDKTWFIMGNQADLCTQSNINSASLIQVSTYSDIATLSNNMLFVTPLEIRVYD